MPAESHDWSVRPVARDDFPHWVRLFRAYAEFYERSLTDQQLEIVWSWIHDEGSVIALTVVPADGGAPVGLAHLRPWIRPLLAARCGYLDDLFVDSEHRGTGAVDALFAAIDVLALDRGWDLVRWTTAVDNHRAQAVYGRYATRTGWVTYDMKPALAPSP